MWVLKSSFLAVFATLDVVWQANEERLNTLFSVCQGFFSPIFYKCVWLNKLSLTPRKAFTSKWGETIDFFFTSRHVSLWWQRELGGLVYTKWVVLIYVLAWFEGTALYFSFSFVSESTEISSNLSQRCSFPGMI